MPRSVSENDPSVSDTTSTNVASFGGGGGGGTRLDLHDDGGGI